MMTRTPAATCEQRVLQPIATVNSQCQCQRLVYQRKRLREIELICAAPERKQHALSHRISTPIINERIYMCDTRLRDARREASVFISSSARHEIIRELMFELVSSEQQTDVSAHVKANNCS